MALEVPCLPVYRKCCFCISAKAGSFILGWISMILHLFLFIAVCVGINRFQFLADQQQQILNMRLAASQEIDDASMQVVVRYQQNMFNFGSFNMVIVLILCMVDVVLGGLMLFGIHNENPSYMVPKLTTSVLSIVVALFAAVYYFIVSVYGFILFYESAPYSPPMETMSITFLVMMIISGVLIPVNAIALYFWNVVYSHYRHLEVSRHGAYGKMMEMAA